MELIDNIDRLFGDDLKRALKPGASLKVAASCFSMYARAEGQRILETPANGSLVFGLGLGALEGRAVATLASGAMPTGRQVQVQVLDASTDPMAVTDVPVFAYARGEEVAVDALQGARSSLPGADATTPA